MGPVGEEMRQESPIRLPGYIATDAGWYSRSLETP